ncbi:MAG TPA: methyltransferase domain-containing protein [Methanocella sp.]|jgi:ubiquinone/menaquinone biosynthesis C-methylase UbiE
MSSVMRDGRELAELYDRISDLQFEGGKRLAARMGVNNGDDVLDVGCGTGRLAVHLAGIVGPSGSVTGIDPSPYRVSVAEEKLKGQGYRNVRIRSGRGEDLGAFRDGRFDDVVYSSVFHWVEDKPAALVEARRVLRDGGRIGINTVDKDHHFAMRQIMEDLITKKYPEHWPMEDAMSHMLVSGRELDGLLQTAGFGDLRVETVSEKHVYSSAKQLFDFIEASSFGNFMRDVPGPVKSRMLEDLGGELEKMRTPAGIELTSKMLYATAVRPL